MNILRKRRKSKNKIKLNKFMIVIFSLVMTTFAWFTYTKILDATLKMHVSSWDIEYYIGTEKKTNPIGIEIQNLYPTMPEQDVTVDIKNNGETLVDIEYEVKSISIAGVTYEVVREGATNKTDNYIFLAPPVLTTDEATGEEIYKDVIINDITRFPFTVEVEHSSQISAVTKDKSGKKVPGIGYLKITVNWIGDNDTLDSEWGYKVGDYLANNPTAASAMSIVLSIESYQADLNSTEKVQAPLPSTTYTKPYMPTGFTRVPGTTLQNGLTIQDSSGNQYVWVEVPKTEEVYPTAGLSITAFTDAEYTLIENDLHKYTSVYRNGTRYTDTHSGNDASTGLTSTQYTELKQKMLKSVYQNGGFYVGRYEIGIDYSEGARSASGSTTQTPVVKENAYPYNWVTCSQAQTLASSMESGEYTSSLMFGVQWDLMIKYLETKGATIKELNRDSTSWGNVLNNTYTIANEKAKYSTTYPYSAWLPATSYTHNNGEITILTTGVSSNFSKQNIYNIAGNIEEWTLEYTSNSRYPCAGRGGDCDSNGDYCSASFRNFVGATLSNHTFGFRPSLF